MSKAGLNSVSVSQEKPFFSLIGLAIYPCPYLQLSEFTRILMRREPDRCSVRVVSWKELGAKKK